jgi:hypothetical protein
MALRVWFIAVLLLLQTRMAKPGFSPWQTIVGDGSTMQSISISSKLLTALSDTRLMVYSCEDGAWRALHAYNNTTNVLHNLEQPIVHEDVFVALNGFGDICQYHSGQSMMSCYALLTRLRATFGNGAIANPKTIAFDGNYVAVTSPSWKLGNGSQLVAVYSLATETVGQVSVASTDISVGFHRSSVTSLGQAFGTSNELLLSIASLAGGNPVSFRLNADLLPSAVLHTTTQLIIISNNSMLAWASAPASIEWSCIDAEFAAASDYRLAFISPEGDIVVYDTIAKNVLLVLQLDPALPPPLMAIARDSLALTLNGSMLIVPFNQSCSIGSLKVGKLQPAVNQTLCDLSLPSIRTVAVHPTIDTPKPEEISTTTWPVPTQATSSAATVSTAAGGSRSGSHSISILMVTCIAVACLGLLVLLTYLRLKRRERRISIKLQMVGLKACCYCSGLTCTQFGACLQLSYTPLSSS